MIRIIKATIENIPDIVPLMDRYRVFYEQQSDITAVTTFLTERLSKNQSIVFLAYKDQHPIGFTQLYTSYSSVSLKPLFILNDLYVKKDHRGMGIGAALLNRSKEICKEMNYKGVALETGINNPAQRLYEKLGWQKDTTCFHYFWTVE